MEPIKMKCIVQKTKKFIGKSCMKYINLCTYFFFHFLSYTPI